MNAQSISLKVLGFGCVFAFVFCNVYSAQEQMCGDEAPPVYSERLEVDTQVDDVRHVDEILLRNNARGDYTVEFMANRTDLPEVSERWTVTYECDDAFDHVQHVEIDGVWRYSMYVENAVEDPVITLATPSESATIDISVVCNAPILNVFKTIAQSIAAERSIVSAVVAEISLQHPLQIPPQNPWKQCVNVNCPPLDHVSPECIDPAFQGDCVVQFSCDYRSCSNWQCHQVCYCNHAPGVVDPQNCLLVTYAHAGACFDNAINDLTGCLDQQQCD